MNFAITSNNRRLLKRTIDNYQIISSTHKQLENNIKEMGSAVPAAEWLFDNYYLIEEQVSFVRRNLAGNSYSRLPVIKEGHLKGYPRVFAISLNLVQDATGFVDENTLVTLVDNYQKQNPLSTGELWLLPIAIRIALIEKIGNICEGLQESSNSKIEQSLEVETERQVLLGNAITSLRLVSDISWPEVFESLSRVEHILRNDPDGTYPEMDFESRDYYRQELEKIARRLNTSEESVASAAIEYAAQHKICEDDRNVKRHVGYYLVGKGRPEFIKKICERGSGNANIQSGVKDTSENRKGVLYLTSILAFTIALSLIFVFYGYNRSDSYGSWFAILALILTVIPCSQLAITIINLILSKLIKPTILPKLELREGIPDRLKTMVIMPTLLPNEERVHELIEQLEVAYLGNREKNLYFALVGDLKDGPREEEDSDDSIIKAAIEGINHLNEKYSTDEEPIFYYMNRKRQYNSSQDKWMGWERKRGAIIEFNRVMRGDKNTSYNTLTCDIEKLPNIKYVITLDADTILPMGTAKKLIGALAHPLHDAYMDNKTKIVKEGYGLLQPRISIGIPVSNTSLFTKIFAGQGGLDPYTTAISDIYQDLFAEGIFTGKGIYNLDIFSESLNNRFPENTILSHDLIEGCHIRTGLLTDLELIDGYPARFNSYAKRLHRWTRGDWQLMPWLFSRVKNANDDVIDNQLSLISKWKIFDNMRRSMLSLALLVLILAGLSILPGSFLIWGGFALPISLLPLISGILGSFLSGKINIGRECVKWFCESFLSFSFMPFMAYYLLDAAIRSVLRVYVTKKNTLEWVTAADAEAGSKNDLQSYASWMWISYIAAIATVLFSLSFHKAALPAAILIALIWVLSPLFAYYTGKPIRKKKAEISASDYTRIRLLAHKIWCYFDEFACKEDNYLPPDNYQEDPPMGVAHRTSPTNIGLLLLSILSAYDLGVINVSSAIKRVEQVITTIEKMPKWKGHLYNWYNSVTLETLKPEYISTVDSGNFVGYLMVLKEGLKDCVNSTIPTANQLQALKDIKMLAENKEDHDYHRAEDAHEPLNLLEYLNLIDEYLEKGINNCGEINDEDACIDPLWNQRLINCVHDIKRELEELYPLANPSNIKELEVLKNVRVGLYEKFLECASLAQLSDLYDKVLDEISGQQPIARAVEIIREADKNVKAAISLVNELSERISSLIENTDFTPLYDNKRHLFSIGFNAEEGQLTKSYYDLLASEARQASFIAIARGEAEPKHWFRLGRRLAASGRAKGLVSWSGTMFEYLMPNIIMKNYDDTLLQETNNFVVQMQKEYGRKKNIPWGVSESGYYAFDINLNYQYKAFGVPGLGFRRGLEMDTVISPYASLLALDIDPEAVLKNLDALDAKEMAGTYGYYEAIDYTSSRRQKDGRGSIVKSYMAHHQGMSLAAINNFINDSVLRERFHRIPLVKSAELLLQERSPDSGLIEMQELRDETVYTPGEEKFQENAAVRHYGVPHSVLPAVHLISNGCYSVMLTDGGSGYSKNGGIAVTRWNNDRITQNSGMFIYIENINSNNAWSATYEPMRQEPEEYSVVFSSDKAEYKRREGNIESLMEIAVSPEDNAEVRKLTLKNHSAHKRVIEITSYMEIVLAPGEEDAAHPAFSKLFVRTEYLKEHQCIVANRRMRKEGQGAIWFMHTLAAEGDIVGEIQYETDRMKFIGRNRDLSQPAAMDPDRPLSNSTGAVLDPIASLRCRIAIEGGGTACVSFSAAMAETRNQALQLAEKYKDLAVADRAFELSWTRSQVENKYLNNSSSDMEMFLELAPMLIYYNPLRKKYGELIRKNRSSQPDLWSMRISGDIPIVLLSIDEKEDEEILTFALKAHEFWKVKGLCADLVILVEKEYGYMQPLREMVRDKVYSIAGGCIDQKGGVFIKGRLDLEEEQIRLLYTSASCILKDGIEAIKEIKGNTSQNMGNDLEDNDKKDYDKCNLYSSQDHGESKGSGIENSHNSMVLKNSGDSSNVKKAGMDFVFDPEKLSFFNGYGGFDDESGEYVIKLDKGRNTPAPWINVISNEKFGFIVSETGGGYTWSLNSRENKLTGWSNDPVTDAAREVIYVRDEQTGEFWSITPAPVRGENPYIIRHGFGYSVFEYIGKGIKQKLTLFTSVENSVKICIIRLANITETDRNLSLTYYIRPVLTALEGSADPYIVTSAEPEKSLLLIENSFSSEFANRIAYLCTSEKNISFTGDRTEFFGINGSLEAPAAMFGELKGRVGAGLNPCAAIRAEVKIKAGEEKTCVFLLGQEESLDDVHAISQMFSKPDAAQNELEQVMKFWREKLGLIKVKTPDKAFDIMHNGRLLYQVIACRMWARSAFYQSGGAFGFRDQLQDSMATMYTWPELTRQQILLHASRQFAEGDVQHWWHAERGRGIRTKYSDDLLWLPFTTAEYIEKTGDWAILDEESSYIDSPLLGEDEDERYETPIVSDKKSSLYLHCISAIDKSLRFGAHGLPLMGSGDWNDGMNTVGNKGKGESVWLGWFIYTVLNKFIPICRERNDTEKMKKYQEAARLIAINLEKEAWDGSWYKRAFFDNGTPLGSVQNDECRIDSISQSWSVISGAGKPERTREAMGAVEKYLVNREYGIIKLLEPPFDDGVLKPGYIKAYVPGVRENGGQYTHAAAWVVLAFAMLGLGNTAWEMMELINPINHSKSSLDVMRYKTEPYVIAADVYAVLANAGRGGWSWYTGAAGWIYRVGIEYLLGFKKLGNKLSFDPCIPDDWRHFEMEYSYGKTKYVIRIYNPDGVCKGVRKLVCDGSVIDTDCVELVDDGKTHHIEVEMGTD